VRSSGVTCCGATPCSGPTLSKRPAAARTTDGVPSGVPTRTTSSGSISRRLSREFAWVVRWIAPGFRRRSKSEARQRELPLSSARVLLRAPPLAASGPGRRRRRGGRMMSASLSIVRGAPGRAQPRSAPTSAASGPEGSVGPRTHTFLWTGLSLPTGFGVRARGCPPRGLQSSLDPWASSRVAPESARSRQPSPGPGSRRASQSAPLPPRGTW
jgi:hypothetical protein